MSTCFFTVYDERAKDMATGMINSVKHWYPNIPMEAIEIDVREADGGFDLQGYCRDILTNGLKLLDEYDKIIYIDPDSVMCNACPDFFEEYDLGCVQNNTVCGPEYGGTKDEDYVNAGLVVCSSKKVWQRILEDYEKRNNKEWSTLNHQNALNLIYHSISNSKLLEFSDRSYGISSLAHYQDIELRQRGDIMLSEPQYELWLPSNKKLCVFHAAGVYWKTGNKVNYDYIKNEDARNLLISYTHA